jgi:hypothetical protein
MKALSLLVVAGVVAFAILGCGEAGVEFDVRPCRGHCESCGSSSECCDGRVCRWSLGGSARCVDFAGEICP